MSNELMLNHDELLTFLNKFDQVPFALYFGSPESSRPISSSGNRRKRGGLVTTATWPRLSPFSRSIPFRQCRMTAKFRGAPAWLRFQGY